MALIDDPELAKAISRILQRSERQEDSRKMIDTFVDVGILPQIENTNNQVIYGRRGTGKTHIFRVYMSKLKATRNNCVVYIDARTLGSSSQFSDPNLPLNMRCLSLFRDILISLYEELLVHIFEIGCDSALTPLNLFAEVSTETHKKITESTFSIKDKNIDKQGHELSATLSEANAVLSVNTGTSIESEAETTVNYSATHENKIIFPDIQKSINDVLRESKSHLYILLDEWSSLPMDLQPFLAEFCKRSFITLPQITMKIAALEHRTNFYELKGKINFGFELGADIATSVDIDDYYVYDRSPKAITDNFSEILYKHILIELDKEYVHETLKIDDLTSFNKYIYSAPATLEELVRASEGVIRDLINIFTSAFFDSKRRQKSAIDKKGVIEASRQWFEKDKAQGLDKKMHDVLRRIVDEVIGKRKARSFLVSRDLEKNILILKLFDARVIHLIKRGYADKVSPGNRFNIYTLDYGTYVDLINTSNEPEIEMKEIIEGEISDDLVVPFDDKRSIRRIVLTADILS